MAELSTIARPYAEAVFKLADASSSLTLWSTTLAELAALATTAEVRTLIVDPNLTPDQIYGVLAVPNLPQEAQNFLRVVIEHGRVAALPEVRALFEELKNEREGFDDAVIETAFALDDAQVQSVVAQLESRFKRKIRPSVTVKRELIGGMRITVGDEVIDASVRGKLAVMSTELSKP
jgi:F-type H+-transporting ATPase subunit delta